MRNEKNLIKDAIAKKFDEHDSFVIVQYVALQANDANEFRRTVAKAGGEFEVARKRIFQKAAAACNISLNPDGLEGHIGIVFLGNEPIETTKAILQFSKNKNKAVLLHGGRFEGKMYYNGADVEKISQLPTKDEMRAQLLGLLEAPMAQTLAVIEALLTSVPYCLDNKIKQSDSDNE